MAPDELREAVALAMREHWRNQCDIRTRSLNWSDISAGDQAAWLSQADAALAVVREALREPSEAMVHQGGASSDHPSVFMGGPSHNGKTKAERIWRAMLAASPMGDK